jgi:hypothetical protein
VPRRPNLAAILSDPGDVDVIYRPQPEGHKCNLPGPDAFGVRNANGAVVRCRECGQHYRYGGSLSGLVGWHKASRWTVWRAKRKATRD